MPRAGASTLGKHAWVSAFDGKVRVQTPGVWYDDSSDGVNLVLRLAFRDLTVVAGLLPVLGAGGASSVVNSLLASVDVFVIWSLTVFAIGVPASTTVGVATSSMVAFALWATVLLCSFFLGQGAGWTM